MTDAYRRCASTGHKKNIAMALFLVRLSIIGIEELHSSKELFIFSLWSVLYVCARMVSFLGDRKIEMKKPCIFPFIMQKLVSLIKNRIWKESARRLSKTMTFFYCFKNDQRRLLFFKEQQLCVVGDNNFYLGEKKKYLGHRFI